MKGHNRWIEIPEDGANNEIAKLYSDIRRVTAMPFVNLVYRYIAGIPGGLSEVWPVLRPLYTSNAIVEVGERLLKEVNVPSLPSIPEIFLDAAGISSIDQKQITDILNFYIRGNTMNLLAMSALCQLEQQDRRIASFEGDVALGTDIDDLGRVRSLLRHDQLDEQTASLVYMLNKLGEGVAPDFIAPSLFRHLAHWPVFLTVAGTYLLPSHVSGELATGADSLKNKADFLSCSMLRRVTLPGIRVSPTESFLQSQKIGRHFTCFTIPRLLLISITLRKAIQV